MLLPENATVGMPVTIGLCPKCNEEHSWVVAGYEDGRVYDDGRRLTLRKPTKGNQPCGLTGVGVHYSDIHPVLIGSQV